MILVIVLTIAICDNHLHLEKRNKSATLHAVPPLQGFYWPFYIYIHCILYIIQAKKNLYWVTYSILGLVIWLFQKIIFLATFGLQARRYNFVVHWSGSIWCHGIHHEKLYFLWKLAIPCPSWKWAVWSLKQTSQNQFLSTCWQEF